LYRILDFIGRQCKCIRTGVTELSNTPKTCCDGCTITITVVPEPTRTQLTGVVVPEPTRTQLTGVLVPLHGDDVKLSIELLSYC